MASTCKLSLNNGAIKETDYIIFHSWIDSAWGKYIPTGTKYAEVIIDNQKAFLVTTCECQLLEKAELNKGDKIEPTTMIGTFACDGELIPYEKPYSKVEI